MTSMAFEPLPDRSAVVRTAVALLNLPVLIDVVDGRVRVHLTGPIVAVDEARLLNVIAHLCPSYVLDPIAGPAPAMKALPVGWWAEFVGRHPEYTTAV